MASRRAAPNFRQSVSTGARSATVLLAWLALAHPAPALEPALAAPGITLQAAGTVQLAFTPGDEADRIVVGAIGKARRQVLVQAFSFTHRRIAEALIAALRRGVDVQVIADRQQAWGISGDLIAKLAAAGVQVFLDGDHEAAHSKAMVIDQGFSEGVVITGSYNFTYAAQYRNAENLVVFHGHSAVVDAYFANWKRHREHAEPYLRLMQN
ncbi:MAG: phospholipase D family protein [Betaproteobacteria bacterium]|nr:phospholipase D family protein [Betaproteobacteria bacterium]